MQVSLSPPTSAKLNLAPPAGVGQPPYRPTDAQCELLLSGLLQLLDRQAAARPPDDRATRQEPADDDRDRRQRRRDADLRDAPQTPANTLQSSDAATESERDTLSGSRAAARRELAQSARDRLSEAPRDFRQALADAAARSKADRPQPPAKDATATPSGAKTSAARSSSPTSPSGGPAASAAATTGTGENTAASSQPNAPTFSAAPAGDAAAPATAPVGNAATQVARTPTGPVAPCLAPTCDAPTASPTTGATLVAKITAATAKTSLTAVREVSAASSAGERTSTTGGRATPAQVGGAATQRATGTAAAKSSAATGSAEPTEEGSSDANVARVMRLVLSRLGQDRSVATLRLDPPELGSLRLRLDLHGDQLSLQIDTQTPAAQRLLSQQLDALRHSLEAAGIQLDRVEVRAPAATHDAARPDTQPQPDVWAQHQDGRGQSQTGSAGGGLAQGTEAPSGSSSDPVVPETTSEPAAESLVNLLA